MHKEWAVPAAVVAALLTGATMDAAEDGAKRLNPRGQIHLPIGLANTLDTLKTFVEAEGNFSPGFATYGIYFWVFDHAGRSLTAPTMDGVPCRHGLAEGGLLIPWSEWQAGDVLVRTEVCQVQRPSPAGDLYVVAARATLKNPSAQRRELTLYAALRPLGPAGGAVKKLAVSDAGDALLVDGHLAILAGERPTAAGVMATDQIGVTALGGTGSNPSPYPLPQGARANNDTLPPATLSGGMPEGRTASSETGDCSGALRFDVALEPGASRSFGFVCPVLPGRRAVGHQWDGVSTWAQADLEKPNPPTGGLPQPDPGVGYYNTLRVDELFDQARRYWEALVRNVKLRLPEARWTEAFAAIAGHVALCMNDGAPDVSVINYNVFNRDGVYVANILQKSGRSDLAAAAIDYFLAHPFNGRVHPEADNPGQILWVMGEQWRFTRDKQWLAKVYPGARKLVKLIEYYRTTPGPHWVQLDSLDFGDALPAAKRKELKPGSCDGQHPEYTEAFDVAGLRAAARLAKEMGQTADAAGCDQLAAKLFAAYDARFAARLAQGYGSYAVLWPCRLYPFEQGKAHEQFSAVGAQVPKGWRYFPLARAHQGLLAGNREAGCETIRQHLDHPQMRGWYVFDEGGRSGSGGWPHARTTWNGSVAMPHGWAIAELHLLLRDSLAFEQDDKLVLLAGVPPTWFQHAEGFSIGDLPTYFGKLSLSWKPSGKTASVELAGAAPPAGFVLRLPPGLAASAESDGKALEVAPSGDCLLPAGTRAATVRFK